MIKNICVGVKAYLTAIEIEWQVENLYHDIYKIPESLHAIPKVIDLNNKWRRLIEYLSVLLPAGIYLSIPAYVLIFFYKLLCSLFKIGFLKKKKITRKI